MKSKQWFSFVDNNPTVSVMEVDCNLKKLANFFKFFLCILEN